MKQKKQKRQLTDTEWELAEKLVSVLKFVQKGTKMMEGDKYPTISVLGPIVYWIYDSLRNSNIPLHTPSFLDPRTKQMKPFSETVTNIQ